MIYNQPGFLLGKAGGAASHEHIHTRFLQNLPWLQRLMAALCSELDHYDPVFPAL